MRLQIDCSEYRNAWGKAPRGFGAWSFRILTSNGFPVMEQASGLYGQALKVARATARRVNGHTIRVEA